MEFIPTETSQKAYAVSQINIYSSHFHKPQNTSTPLVSMAIQRELLQMGDGGLNSLGSQKSLFSSHLLVLFSNGFHSNSLAAQTACKCSESLQLLQLLLMLRCIRMLRACVECHQVSKDCVNRPLVQKPLTTAVPLPSYHSAKLNKQISLCISRDNNPAETLACANTQRNCRMLLNLQNKAWYPVQTSVFL